MIRIAILNKDGFYSKLLAERLKKVFPGKLKRITVFNSSDDVIKNLDLIVKYDVIAIGDGICEDYPQLVKILKSKKCIANSNRFYRNNAMMNAGAHWLIPKDAIANSYTNDLDSMKEWIKPISDWFF